MIICTPKDTLSEKQKEAVAAKGLILIECDDPEKIRVINIETAYDANDFFMAALFGLTVMSPVNARDQFVNNLYKRLKEKEPVEKKEPV